MNAQHDSPLPNQAVPPKTFSPHDDPKQRPLGEPPGSPKHAEDPRKLPKKEIFEPTTPDLPSTGSIPEIQEPN